MDNSKEDAVLPNDNPLVDDVAEFNTGDDVAAVDEPAMADENVPDPDPARLRLGEFFALEKTSAGGTHPAGLFGSLSLGSLLSPCVPPGD